MKRWLPFIFLLLGVFYAPVIRDARGDVLAEVVNAAPICAVSRSTVYDPDLGRWTSRDPIGETGGQNLYEYAANDPINNVDPNGLCPQPGGIFGNGQYRDEDGNVRDGNGDLIKDQLDPLNPINFEGGNSPLNFTPEDAAMGAAEGGTAARFIVSDSGQVLDTSAITIPGPANSAFGKIDYLLGNVTTGDSATLSAGKGGFFSGVMGYDQTTLGPALQSQLIDNFGNAVINGNRMSVIGPMTGPSGTTANVLTAWQVTPSGSVSLITAFPK